MSESTESKINDSLDAKATILLGIFLISALIALIGIIGNIALILFYKKKGLNTRFNQLLVTLATFDLIFLLVIPSVPASFYFVSTAKTNGFLALFNIAYIVSYTALKGSIFTTIAITAERYLVDCKSVNTTKYSIWYTIGTIITAALVLSLPSMSFTADFLAAKEETKAEKYLTATASINLILVSVIPTIILIYMNVELRKYLKECVEQLNSYRGSINTASNLNLAKSTFQAKFALTISSIFVASQILLWIPNIYKVSHKIRKELLDLQKQFFLLVDDYRNEIWLLWIFQYLYALLVFWSFECYLVLIFEVLHSQTPGLSRIKATISLTYFGANTILFRIILEYFPI